MSTLSTAQRQGFTTLNPGTTATKEGGVMIAEGLKGYAQGLLNGGAAALSTLLNRQIGLTAQPAEEIELAVLTDRFPLPWVLVEVRFARGFSGGQWLIFKQQDAMAFAQLMLGEEFSAFSDFTSVHEDAMREAINQMMGSAGSSLKVLLSRPVSFGPADLRRVEEPTHWHQVLVGNELRQWVVEARLAVEGELSSQILLVVGKALGQEIAGILSASESSADRKDAPANPKEREGGTPSGIELILDISLPVTVELGRSRMLVRDILNLAPGSVIELDKLAGEPVDLLVNDKPIAKGEVVVIEENFGVRLTSIVNTTERIKNLR